MREAHQKVKNERNAKRDALILLLQDYYGQKITSEELNAQKTLLEDYITYKNLSNIHFEKILKREENHRFFGFMSVNAFAFQLSVYLVLLFAVLVLYLVSLKLTDRQLRKPLNHVTFIFASIAFYYITWVFYPQGDLPFYSYILMMVFIAVLTTITVRYFLRWLSAKYLPILKLKHIIQLLISHIVVTVQHKYVSKEQKKAYIKDYIKVLGKGTK